MYICPWCDRVFRSETERIGHLLTGHGVEVREEEEGEGEEGGASTPHPFILPRSHTEEEQDQLGEYVMRSAGRQSNNGVEYRYHILVFKLLLAYT